MGITTSPETIATPETRNQRKEFDFRQVLRIISIVIPLAVIGNIIYAVIASQSDVLNMFSQFRLDYIFLAMVLVTIPLGCHTSRMLLWSRKFKVDLKPVQAFKTSVITDIGSAASPTIIGGGYVKLLFLIGYGFTPGRATLMMVLGTLEDILFFTIALPVVIYFTHAWDNPYVIAAVKNLISHWPVLLGLAVGISILIYFYKRKKNKHRNIISNNKNQDTEKQGLRTRLVMRLKHYKEDFLVAVRYVIKEGKGTLLLSALISGIGWSCRYASINALILGLGYDVDPLLFTLLHWVVFSTMTMIPTPGAVGGAEISFALVFSGLIPSSIIPVMTGVWRFITFYMVIAIGSVYMAIVGPKFPAKRDISKNGNEYNTNP